MAIIKNREKDSIEVKKTFIAKNIKIEGNFTGEGAIQIEGYIIGDITLDSVIIGEEGRVKGNINSNSIIIRGKQEGNIQSKSLEVTPNGQINNQQTKVKNILICGSIKGNVIASGILEVDVKGSIEGDITFGQIKINEGGRIIGSLQENIEKSR